MRYLVFTLLGHKMWSGRTILLTLMLSLAAWPCTGASNVKRAARQAEELNMAFASAVEKVMPSVVVILVKLKPEEQPPDEVLSKDDDPNDNLNSDFWLYYRKKFYETPRERGIGRGSGLIIRKNGFILTNRHVVEDAESIQVRLHDRRTYQARIHSQDSLSDLAILKIEADGLPMARLGNSDNVKVGEFAIAIGAPYSFDYSVTFGHISAKGRSNVLPSSMGGTVMEQDYIQTDALINPGNSGGPLLNIRGEVIGINTLIQGMNTGIGFAVPSRLAQAVSDQLIASGKYSRPWIGLELRSLGDVPDLPSKPGAGYGVMVVKVLPGGPAAGSDLNPGDIIIQANGRPVATPQELRQIVRAHRIGELITFEVWRDGRRIERRIRTGELVEPQPTPETGPETPAPKDKAYPEVGKELSDAGDQLQIAVCGRLG
jgi:serine protease Do